MQVKKHKGCVLSRARRHFFHADAMSMLRMENAATRGEILRRIDVKVCRWLLLLDLFWICFGFVLDLFCDSRL